MALIRIPDENRTISDPAAIRAFLGARGIEYEHWEPTTDVPASHTADEILAAYAPKISELKARGGSVTADVTDVKPETPNLDAMLLKFSSEHWHDEDEVRLIVEG